MKTDIREDLLELFSEVSDEDMGRLYNALVQVNEILKQVMDI